MIRVGKEQDLKELLIKCELYNKNRYLVANSTEVKKHKEALHIAHSTTEGRYAMNVPIYCYETNRLYMIIDSGKGECKVEVIGHDDVVRFMGFPQEPLSIESVLVVVLIFEIISIPFAAMFPGNFLVSIPTAINVLYLMLGIFKLRFGNFFMILFYPAILFVYLEYFILEHTLAIIVNMKNSIFKIISNSENDESKRRYKLHR